MEGGGSTVGIPSSTCKNVLTVRTQTQTQLSTASMRGSRSGSWQGNKVCSTANSSPRRLLSVVATEAEITQ